MNTIKALGVALLSVFLVVDMIEVGDARQEARAEAVVARISESSTVLFAGEHGHGSAVLLRRSNGLWAITAGHCVVGAQATNGSVITLSQPLYIGHQLIGERRLNARVVTFDVDQDLALLKIADGDSQNILAASIFLTPRGRITPVGTRIWHSGAPLDRDLVTTVMPGVITAVGRTIDGQDYWQTSALAYPGCSGGGVFTEDGYLLGILVRGGAPGINFIVPTHRIRQWAEANGLSWLLQ